MEKTKNMHESTNRRIMLIWQHFEGCEIWWYDFAHEWNVCKRFKMIIKKSEHKQIQFIVDDN